MIQKMSEENMLYVIHVLQNLILVDTNIILDVLMKREPYKYF